MTGLVFPQDPTARLEAPRREYIEHVFYHLTPEAREELAVMSWDRDTLDLDSRIEAYVLGSGAMTWAVVRGSERQPIPAALVGTWPLWPNVWSVFLLPTP